VLVWGVALAYSVHKVKSKRLGFGLKCFADRQTNRANGKKGVGRV
jgi:hypothetical protein